MALQIRIPFGVPSKLTIIVEPVVVIPDMLSKNESVILNFKSENINFSNEKFLDKYNKLTALIDVKRIEEVMKGGK